MKPLGNHWSVFIISLSLSLFATTGVMAGAAKLANPCPAKSADSAKWALLVDTSKPETIAPAMEALTCALEKCHPGLLTVYRDQDQRTVEVGGVTSTGQCKVKIIVVAELGQRGFDCGIPKGTAPWLGLLEDNPVSGLPAGQCQPLEQSSK